MHDDMSLEEEYKALDLFTGNIRVCLSTIVNQHIRNMSLATLSRLMFRKLVYLESSETDYVIRLTKEGREHHAMLESYVNL